MLTQQTSADIIRACGLDADATAAGTLLKRTPIDGSVIARLRIDTPESVAGRIARAEGAFRRWRQVPAPRRGELVRRLGVALRESLEPLARLVTLECGKGLAEARGEVQEMIDICDFATGLSRQLYGLTMPSERPGHRLMECWHPYGVSGVITAFNFPVAVWSWNAALALVCGNAVIWKPSEKTPLCALACARILDGVCAGFGDDAPADLHQVIIGDSATAAAMVRSEEVPLISATGSTAMGRQVAPVVARRFGRCLLELGGNNAVIVTPAADPELAVRAIVFAAAGTCGQRCTTLRRLIVHHSIREGLLDRLRTLYDRLPVGNPLDPATLIGPLIDGEAAAAMAAALEQARDEGGTVYGGGRVTDGVPAGGCYVRPALVSMPEQSAIVSRETFAPILYVMDYDTLDGALAMHNGVRQGLSSGIFSSDLGEIEAFLAASDCGLANVNIGPSGAEIGGAFGGEKDTGGGRESGSDAWKGYMRRQTTTINHSNALPLAQGLEFSV